MVKLLEDNQTLPMDAVSVDESGFFLVGKNIKKYSFRIMETSQAFETVSAQGCHNIIRYYFSPEMIESETNKKSDCKESIKLNAKDLFMKPKFGLNEENNVISKLFEMGIPVYVDDISGSPKIGYLTLK